MKPPETPCKTCGFDPCACILRGLFRDRVGKLWAASLVPEADREGIAKPIYDDLMDQYRRLTECFTYWMGVLHWPPERTSAVAHFIADGQDGPEASRAAWEDEVSARIALAAECRTQAARISR